MFKKYNEQSEILLVNPPAKETVIRDYCCGHTTKANYCWAPVDLLVLSGVLSKKYKNISIVDSVIDGSSFENGLMVAGNKKPDVVISLISAISLKEDMKYLADLKKITGALILVIGDFAYFQPEDLLREYEFIDGIIFSFVSEEILKFLEGMRDVNDMAYRGKEKLIIGKREINKNFQYNLPKHELFPLKKYSMPYSMYSPMTTILSSYGCPYKCNFCNSGKLPYSQRDQGNVLEELKYLKKLGIREFYMRDFTFTLDKERVLKLCKEIINCKLDLKWSCDGRLDNIDEEMLKLMKCAGCYLIFFGIESSSDSILADSEKGLKAQKIIDGLKMCKKIGILTLGSFIIGLPTDTEKSIYKTIEFSKKIHLDYASFNLFVPRYGTELRGQLLNKRYIKEEVKQLDSSKEGVPACGISPIKLKKLHRKAIRGFYFRPKQLIKFLSNIKTKHQLSNLIKNGIGVFKIILGAK